MLLTIRCPNPGCGRSFSIEEAHLGKRGRCKTCGTAFTLSTVDDPRLSRSSGPTPASSSGPQTLKSSAPEQLGRFVIKRRLGAGAFGAVYQAYDPQLDRQVALKVPQPGTLETPQAIERFLREAKAAAQLRHPHIVPVYDAGREGPHAYIATALIEGRTLADAVADGPLPADEAARIVAALAEALGYAHSLGVIHRDVKPANVMLDTNGQPHLMDFGLARLESSAEKLTHDGAVLGTPAYMSPEQAQGKDVTAASDQYSLGVVLYELLCAETPFHGPAAVVIHNLLNREPELPRSINSAVPPDLETVCLKAMARTPQGRYEDCQSLADDLERWIEDVPITARRVSAIERLVKWARREPGIAASLSFVVLIGVVAFGIVAREWARAEREKSRAENQVQATVQALGEAQRQERRAQEQLNRAETSRYISTIRSAHRELDDGFPFQALSTLEQCDKSRRDWEYNYLRAQCYARLRVQFSTGWWRNDKSLGWGRDLDALVWFDYRTIFYMNPVGTLHRKWTLDEARWPTNSTTLSAICLAPNGRLIAMSASRMPLQPSLTDVVLWDAEKGDPSLALPGSLTQATSMAFSEDGARLAVVGFDSRGIGSDAQHFPQLRLWDVNTQRLLWTFDGQSRGRMNAVRFVPDGQHLVTAEADESRNGGKGGKLRLWTGGERGGQEVRAVSLPSEAISIACHPGGREIAVAVSDGSVFVWQPFDRPDEPRFVSMIAKIKEIRYAPSADSLICRSDLGVGLYDVATGVMRVEFPKMADLLWGTSDKRLASIVGSVVSLWDTRSAGDRSLRGHPGEVHHVAFAPDGVRLASLSQEGSSAEVRVWNLATSEEPSIHRLDRYIPPFDNHLSFAQDGQTVLAGENRTGVLALNSAAGSSAAGISSLPEGNEYMTVAFSNDRKTAALAMTVPGIRTRQSQDGTVLYSDQYLVAYDLVRGQEKARIKGQFTAQQSIALSPDSRTLAVAIHRDSKLRLWDLASGQARDTIRGHFLIRSAKFSPDGKRLLVAGLGQGQKPAYIRLLDLETKAVTLEITDTTLADHQFHVAFSSSGKRLATASHGNTIKIWDVETGMETLVLKGHTNAVTDLAFSPDDHFLASSSRDRTARVWDATDRQPPPLIDVSKVNASAP